MTTSVVTRMIPVLDSGGVSTHPFRAIQRWQDERTLKLGQHADYFISWGLNCMRTNTTWLPFAIINTKLSAEDSWKRSTLRTSAAPSSRVAAFSLIDLEDAYSKDKGNVASPKLHELSNKNNSTVGKTICTDNAKYHKLHLRLLKRYNENDSKSHPKESIKLLKNPTFSRKSKSCISQRKYSNIR